MGGYATHTRVSRAARGNLRHCDRLRLGRWHPAAPPNHHTNQMMLAAATPAGAALCRKALANVSPMEATRCAAPEVVAQRSPAVLAGPRGRAHPLAGSFMLCPGRLMRSQRPRRKRGPASMRRCCRSATGRPGDRSTRRSWAGVSPSGPPARRSSPRCRLPRLRSPLGSSEPVVSSLTPASAGCPLPACALLGQGSRHPAPVAGGWRLRAPVCMCRPAPALRSFFLARP